MSASFSFGSPKNLAKYLKSMTDEEYLSYFWWKDLYEVTQSKSESFCKLCEMLNDESQPHNVYDDLGSWWRRGTCKTKGIPWEKTSWWG